MAFFKDTAKKGKTSARRTGPERVVSKMPKSEPVDAFSKKHIPIGTITAVESSKDVLPSADRKDREQVVPYIRTTKKADDLLSSRYELKYRISESKAQAVKTFVQNFLPMDRYARMHPDGMYPISSLYLDSENLDLCRETLEGRRNRFKLRIRAYDDNPRSPVFFEIKRRADKIILKSRAQVERACLSAVLDGSMQYRAQNKKEQEALDQFLFYKQMIQGRPVVLVRYWREPFEGDTEHRVRVTFDRHLCYKPVARPEVMLNGSGWHQVPISFVILEVKFTDRYPAWVRQLVQLFNLNRSSMSKYVSSVKQSRQAGIQQAMPYYLE